MEQNEVRCCSTLNNSQRPIKLNQPLAIKISTRPLELPKLLNLVLPKEWVSEKWVIKILESILQKEEMKQTKKKKRYIKFHFRNLTRHRIEQTKKNALSANLCKNRMYLIKLNIGVRVRVLSTTLNYKFKKRIFYGVKSKMILKKNIKHCIILEKWKILLKQFMKLGMKYMIRYTF